MWLIERNVLLDREVQSRFLASLDAVGVLADVLTRDGMLHNLEGTHRGLDRCFRTDARTIDVNFE